VHRPIKPDEIQIERLVDVLIRDCLSANLPPYPAVIADVLSQIFCQRQSATEHSICFGQLLPVIRERLEFVNATTQPPN
jgi:hypothetical protein